MKKKLAIIDVIIMLILALMCITIMSVTVFKNQWIVKADNETDIIPYAREDGSGTRVAFNSMIGLEKLNWVNELKDETSEDIAIIGSSQEMIIQVSHTNYSLGYVSYAVERESDLVKPLKVNGIKPSINNIRNETYPLIRDFRIVYHENMTDIEKDFLQYIKSEGQGYISNYCVPAREKGIFLPNGAEGNLTISGSTSMTPMMELLADKYMEVNPKANVVVKSSDSESGMMDVLAGNSNFGMVSRSLKSYEKSLLSSERIGRDAIAIIVNPNSDVDDITTSQLKKIYTGSLTSWEYLNVYE